MSTPSSTANTDKLISQLLLEDADLRDIVEEFVGGMGTRVEELQQAFERMDWEMMVVLAHRLKGAAGSYGYPDISTFCSGLEARFRLQDAGDFAADIQVLEKYVAAAVKGLAETPA